MQNSFITFKTFSDPETARDFAEILKQKEISFQIEESLIAYDPSTANSEFLKEYHVKLIPQDFERTNKILEEYYSAFLEKIDPSYYLFEFSNEELQEIITKPDEWGHFDYLLARKLLADRGKEIKTEEAEELKIKRKIDLSKPDPVKKSTIIVAYILGIIIPPIAAFLGAHWAYSKKVLPNGERVPMYSNKDREHGRTILTMGVALSILGIIRIIVRAAPEN